MEDIDLLQIEKKQNKHKHHRRKPVKKLLKLLTYGLIIIIIILFVFTNKIVTSEDSFLKNAFSFLNPLKHLVNSSENMLKGEENGRINILMLGMGGRQHEGGYLTDTIMLASIIPDSGEIFLISIPRDLLIPLEGYGWRKINHVNALAELENSGSGSVAISQALSRTLDMPIDYYVRVDFYGFTKIVDELGGIEIEVENTIDDYFYPILGQEEAEDYDSRFEHLYIAQGKQKMDGDLALKYARSRHTSSIEGSDFARSRRQQKILEAVKDKVLSKYIIFKPKMISNILKTLEEHVDTNFKIWEMVKLWGMVKNTTSDQVTNKVLDSSPNGLLMEYITEEGAYVLQPRTGDFMEIQYYIKNIMAPAPTPEVKIVQNENPTLEIQNGTWINGLGQNTATDLEKFGFATVRITNATSHDHKKSTIYDLTYGEKMNSLKLLKETANADVFYGLPDWLIAELAEKNAEEKDLIQPDFLLVLGQTSDITKSGLENDEE